MKLAKTCAAAALCLFLWGCFLAPGKFDALLDVRKDGSFTYRYDGEIVVVTPHTMMGMAGEGLFDEPFDPETQICFGDSPKAPAGSGKKSRRPRDEDILVDAPEERECTAEEIADKRAEWQEKREQEKKSAEAMRGFFGGLDPQDPKTVDEFIRRLKTYQGWKEVTHKGGGVFAVRYEVAGRLDRDFVFPNLPEIDAVLPFVRASKRADGSVRVTAPVFGQDQSMMNPSGMGAVAAASAPAAQLSTKIPRPEGTFRIRTDAEILTNNTDEGPAAAGTLRELKWTVGPLDVKKPEALIRL